MVRFMIKIDFYSNGMEINGHSHIVTCSEVSMFSWFLQAIIWEVDKTSTYYSTKVNNPENPNEGKTKFRFDKSNEKALWTFEMFRESIKYFRNHKVDSKDWGNMEVIINFIDADLG
jgi:hypothetical protein